MRKILCYVFLFFGAVSWISQPAAGNPKAGKSVLFLWWNVENLFDTHNDPITNDDDFTPEGKLHWTEKKLILKQMRIRHLLSAVKAHPDYNAYPDLLAFAEVENREVFEKTLSGIPGIGYKTIYHNSADPRGIDIGLAFNPQTVQAKASKAYSVASAERATRKIIVAEFLSEGHPFHLILNHWPSRSFDTHWTEPKRVAAANVARHIVDSLLLSKPKADVIIMGDFNDEPGNRSLREGLGSTFDAARLKTNGKKFLYNCWSGYEGIGSYSYKNRWQQIDQILLSAGMFDELGLYAPQNAFRCFSFFRLLDATGNKPYATFEKRKYTGGYSDHLPLLLKSRIMP